MQLAHGLIAALGLVYVVALFSSCGGCGYAGKGGYHRPASFWYWGGIPTYHEPSARTGSTGGPAVPGGGPRRGK